MDRLEEIKSKKLFEYYRVNSDFVSLEDIEYLISEIETLRLDNTYLQQRLQREVEKK